MSEKLSLQGIVDELKREALDDPETGWLSDLASRDLEWEERDEVIVFGEWEGSIDVGHLAGIVESLIDKHTRELKSRLEQAEQDRDAALEANKRWAHRSSRETSDLRKANASIARVRALRNTWCDASYDPMNTGLSIAGTVNAIDRALDGDTRG